MYLPSDPIARRDAFIDIGRLCMSDRSERKAYHQELRAWYTRGTAWADRVRYNKIKEHVKRSASYLYQSEAVRFGAVLPPEFGEQFNTQLEVVRDDFHRYWHDSKAGRVVTLGVRWAHVYPTVVFKVTPHNDESILTFVPDPSDIGVYEPDRPFVRQEAITHCFWLTIGQFRRLVAGHPKEADLIAAAVDAAETGGGPDEPAAPTVERLVFSSVSPTMTGVVTRGVSGGLDAAQVEAARVLLCELWIVDDRVGKWRCVTCFAPAGEIQRVIWDRIPSVLWHSDPFVALTLEDAPDYTWGFSETDDLSGLQDWRESHMNKIDRLMDLQLDAPIVLGGFGGLSDERAKRLRTPGGTLSTALPNPSVHRNAPQMPPEAFAEKESIDRDFAAAGGLPGPLQGQTDPNMRDQHPAQLAALGAAPTIEKAATVEYAVSEMATLMWRVRREIYGDPLTTPEGARFFLHQIPSEMTMEVASHSLSPLFRESTKADALAMVKAGLITKPRAVELMQPPMVDLLRAEARKLEQAAAQRQAQLLKIQEEKALRGRSR
jgi:hypothetical protein